MVASIVTYMLHFTTPDSNISVKHKQGSNAMSSCERERT